MRRESYEDLLERYRALEARLEEAEDTLRAIRSGEVDAFVGAGPNGDCVYTLKGADEAYRIIVQDMAEGAVTVTLGGLILFSNEQFASMAGIALERVIGSHIQDFLVPEDAKVVSALLPRRNGRQAEVRLKSNGAGTVPVYLSVNTLILDGIECVCVIVTDLTEQKRNEEIVAAERLARSILDQAAGAILVVDPEGRIIRASRAAEALANGPVLLRHFDTVFPLRIASGSEKGAFEEILSAVRLDGTVADINATAQMADGRSLNLLVNAALLTGRDSEPLGCTVMFSDITNLKAAENRLRESEERYRLLIEASPMGVASGYVAGENFGEMDSVNESLLAMLGRSRRDLESTPLHWPDVTPPEFLPRHIAAISAARAGGVCKPYEAEVMRQDGSRVPVMMAFALLREKREKVVAFFADLTEQKKSEERLRQAQKLESIGLLAGGIAHDFNNLLTGIMGNASLAIDEAEPEIAENLQAILSSAERAADLTRQLLAYSGKGQFVIKDLDLSRTVREMADLLRLSIPKTVELRLDVRERLPLVAMDPGQFQQILMNLVINAGEAIGDGGPGKIFVSTELCDLTCGFIDALGQEIAPGRYVCLEVTDTGPGMDDGLKSRIFDPFFTTKFTGRGLGLAAVSGVLRTLRGAISVRTAPGEGTTFRVLLPAAQSGRQSNKEMSGPTRGTVLVVDDEETVRNFISAALRKNGFRVLEACDGREALAICENEAEGLDVVVLDLVMPVMGGSEFLEHIRSRRPDLRVLMTSGYNEAEARRLCAAYRRAAFIQKPYTAQQLAAAIERLCRSYR